MTHGPEMRCRVCKRWLKEIRDSASALGHYGRQAHNIEAERRCCEIRLRAERKAGELLAKMEKTKGAPGNQCTGPMPRQDGSKTLAELGITGKQSSHGSGARQFQRRNSRRLSSALESQQPMASLLPEYRPSSRRSAIKHYCFGGVLGTLSGWGSSPLPPDHDARMIADVYQIVPAVIAWLKRIEERVTDPGRLTDHISRPAGHAAGCRASACVRPSAGREIPSKSTLAH
jgi:hypothetical protein